MKFGNEQDRLALSPRMSGSLRVKRENTARRSVAWEECLQSEQRVTVSAAELARRHEAALVADGRVRSLTDWRSWYANWWLAPSGFGQVEDVRRIDRRVLEAWLRARRVDQPPLSPNGIRKVFSMLSSLLAFATSINALDRNPCRDVDRSLLPSKRLLSPERGALSVLTIPECRRLFGLDETPSTVLFWDRLFFAAGVCLGHRFGELAALDREDWHTELAPLSGIHVTKQVATKRGSRVEDGTKDGSPKQSPVPKYLRTLLEQVPARFEEQAGRAWGPKDPLLPFFAETAPNVVRRWNQRTALRRYQAVLGACGIREPITGPRTVHSLRHTFITRLRRAGADPLAVRFLTHPGSVRGLRRGDAHSHYDHTLDLDWPFLCRAVATFDLDRTDDDEPTQLGLHLWRKTT